MWKICIFTITYKYPQRVFLKRSKREMDKGKTELKQRVI